MVATKPSGLWGCVGAVRAAGANASENPTVRRPGLYNMGSLFVVVLPPRFVLQSLPGKRCGVLLTARSTIPRRASLAVSIRQHHTVTVPSPPPLTARYCPAARVFIKGFSAGTLGVMVEPSRCQELTAVETVGTPGGYDILNSDGHSVGFVWETDERWMGELRLVELPDGQLCAADPEGELPRGASLWTSITYRSGTPPEVIAALSHLLGMTAPLPLPTYPLRY